MAIPRLLEKLTCREAFIGVRPEHIILSDRGDIRGEVFAVEYMGARQLITVDTQSGRLKVRAGNRVKARIGETVGLKFDRKSLIVFDAQTNLAVDSELYNGYVNG